MTDDGTIDYSKFERAQLLEALSRVDRSRYPHNFEALNRELHSRGPKAIPQVSDTALRLKPVSMWPYLGASLLCGNFMFAIAIFAKIRFGVTAPMLFGLTNAFISSAVPAYLFFATHRRPLLSVEQRWLTGGCFLVFWFYDGFLRTAHTFIHGEETLRDTLSEIGGAVFDFVLVLGIVHALAFWGAKRYRMLHTVSPPNNRWRGQ